MLQANHMLIIVHNVNIQDGDICRSEKWRITDEISERKMKEGRSLSHEKEMRKLRMKEQIKKNRD